MVLHLDQIEWNWVIKWGIIIKRKEQDCIAENGSDLCWEIKSDPSRAYLSNVWNFFFGHVVLFHVACRLFFGEKNISGGLCCHVSTLVHFIFLSLSTEFPPEHELLIKLVALKPPGMTFFSPLLFKFIYSEPLEWKRFFPSSFSMQSRPFFPSGSTS